MRSCPETSRRTSARPFEDASASRSSSRSLAPRALIALVVLAVASTGCRTVRPWERGKLAHPTMATEPMQQGAAEEHMRSVQEGATGGTSGIGGGCGCN